VSTFVRLTTEEGEMYVDMDRVAYVRESKEHGLVITFDGGSWRASTSKLGDIFPEHVDGVEGEMGWEVCGN